MPGVTHRSAARPSSSARWRAHVGDYAADARLSPRRGARRGRHRRGRGHRLRRRDGRRALASGSRTSAGCSAGGVLAARVRSSRPRGRTARALLLEPTGAAPRELPGGGRLGRAPGLVARRRACSRRPRGGCSAVERRRRASLETRAARRAPSRAWRGAGTASELATCCYGGVHLWDGRGRRARGTCRGRARSSRSPGARTARSSRAAARTASVHFWRLATGRGLARCAATRSSRKAIAWDAGVHAARDRRGTRRSRVWEFAGKGPEGKPPLELVGHKALCTVLAFAPKALCWPAAPRTRA